MQVLAASRNLNAAAASAVTAGLAPTGFARAEGMAMPQDQTMAGPADTKVQVAGGKMEMCFGVALKGQHDCATGPGAASAGIKTRSGDGALKPVERP